MLVHSYTHREHEKILPTAIKVAEAIQNIKKSKNQVYNDD